MGKPSILSLTLLFSMLFILAKGSRVQLKNFESNSPQSDFSDEVKKWYDVLSKKQPTNCQFTVYLHANNKVNQIQVAHSLVPDSTPPFFGDNYAFDYLATETSDVTSKYLGAGQGFFEVNSKEQFAALLGINLSLTEYSNNTITFLGQDRFNDKYRELSIVGGTGHFRLATGSGIMYNVYRVPDIAIIKLTVFVRYYEEAKAAA